MRLGKRCYRDDEEPEKEWVSLWEHGQGLCEFCGHADHRRDKCPNRPAASVGLAPQRRADTRR